MERNRLKYQPKDMMKPEFELLDELNHQELMPFLRKYLKNNKFLFYFINFHLFTFATICFHPKR